MKPRVRLGFLAVGLLLVVIFGYLSIPGHILGTFFYDIAPSRFRSTIGYSHKNSAEFWIEVKNHLIATGISVGVAGLLCIPLGILASRIRILAVAATNIVSIARGIPGIAMIFLMWPWFGVGMKPAIIALTILAAPPIFLNTTAGYASVDTAVVEAARGMGMNKLQVLAGIETPLALSVVIAGLRTATIEVIASATIAAYISYDTLGTQIATGVDFYDTTMGKDALFLGIFGIATMALLAEISLSAIQRLVAQPSS